MRVPKKFEKVERAGFIGDMNDFVDADGHYHDEWFASLNGGGQEIVEVEGEKFTRLYGGGVIPQEELQEIGITTKDVISRLISSVNELKEKTRLHTPFFLELPDGWRYEYSILKKGSEVPLTVGWESITLNGREVFAHAFILSPIK